MKHTHANLPILVLYIRVIEIRVADSVSLCDVACFFVRVLFGLSVCRRRFTVFFVCVNVALYVFCPYVLCILTQPISKILPFFRKKKVILKNGNFKKNKKKN